MDVGGGYILTDEQEQLWMNDPDHKDEYLEYIDSGLYDPDTNELFDIPEWMNDGDPNNGPFDFQLNPSHGTIGW